MLLRASGEARGSQVDIRAVTDPAAAARSGIEHAELLVAFAEAEVGTDDDALARVRSRVRSEMGSDALVDASAVASNFERMVRIADSTGIPVDGAMQVLAADLQEDLGLGRFGSAANSPRVSAAKRVVGRALQPLVRGALRLFSRRARGAAGS